jgi:hypothetical protein
MVFLFKYSSLTMQLTWFFEIDFPECDTFLPVVVLESRSTASAAMVAHHYCSATRRGGVDMCKVTGVEREGSVSVRPFLDWSASLGSLPPLEGFSSHLLLP